MRLFAQVRSCLKWLMNRSQMESAMESEVDFHIESYAEDLVRDGASRRKLCGARGSSSAGLSPIKMPFVGRLACAGWMTCG